MPNFLKFAVLIVMVSNTAFAETVVNYQDGSTYTLQNNEQIYISKNNNIYSLTGSTTGTTMRFFKEKPWSKRDHTPEPFTGDEICWEWGGVAPPPGYSVEACYEEQSEPVECNPDGLSFGGGC